MKNKSETVQFVCSVMLLSYDYQIKQKICKI
jgi:hypothetical protein